MAFEHKKLIDTIYKLTGNFIEEDKTYLLDTRLRDLIKDKELKNYDEVADYLESKKDLQFEQNVIDRITTHETRFFRDESIFDALVLQVIPEWMQKKEISPLALKGTKLNIWSAASSTGQEAYSILMMLYEKLPYIAEVTNIIATDISDHSLAKASSATYSKFEVSRGIPTHLLNKYLEPVGDKFKFISKIRDKVKFQNHNLISGLNPGMFDIVYCRNVLIYFPEEQRRLILQKIKNAITSNGVLFMGSSESLVGYLENYVLREYGLARYYELNNSMVTMFKRSKKK